MPGRPRKPTKLHELQGTGRKARLAARAGELDLSGCPAGEPPSVLGDEGKRYWRELVEHEVYGRILTWADRGPLLHLCLLFERLIADAKAERTMTASERQTYHSLCMQMGLTPSSRSRIATPGDKPEASPWDQFEKMGTR
jgi:phage terminase small subunit